MLKGFRDFIMRGSVVDMAVGIVIGVAFTSLVSAFTDALINPLIKVFMGGGVKGGTFQISGVTFDPALFINAIITFLITAAVIYFLVVLPMNKFRARFMKAETPEETPADVALLTEIRDELRARRQG
ncbi:MAG: large conductance mechanosensitive channel protein MscL [Micromonosporaceae bacterium]|nr:large conductance mechanosensitive channel protein MscL [Micromonosporaceae bacterium]